MLSELSFLCVFDEQANGQILSHFCGMEEREKKKMEVIRKIPQKTHRSITKCRWHAEGHCKAQPSIPWSGGPVLLNSLAYVSKDSVPGN